MHALAACSIRERAAHATCETSAGATGSTDAERAEAGRELGGEGGADGAVPGVEASVSDVGVVCTVGTSISDLVASGAAPLALSAEARQRTP